MSSHEQVRLGLGSYALGNLDAPERAQLALHLRTCEDCRAELVRLRAAAELVPFARDAVAVEEPSALLGRRVLAGRPRRSRLRVALPSAAAGALATAAVALAWPHGDGTHVELKAAGSRDWAKAEIYDTGSGVRVVLDAALAPTRGSEVYEVWFVRSTGRVSAGTFRIGAGGRAHMTLNAAVRPEAYARIGITREPDQLDPACNGPAVVTAAL